MNQAYLKGIVCYDKDTGLFTWATSRCSHAIEGRSAGTIRRSGYVELDIDRKRYFAHRLAWLYVTGSWPAGPIDHKNGRRSDNRWINLRDATPTINSQNTSRARKDSATGIAGVFKRSSGSGFFSVIQAAGKRRYLGSFPTIEEASAAYQGAKKLLHPEAIALQKSQ